MLKNQTDKRVETFQNTLEGVGCGMAAIQSKTHNVTIMCKDPDEITTSEKIYEALQKEWGKQMLKVCEKSIVAHK